MSRVDVLPHLNNDSVYCQQNKQGRFECAGRELKNGDIVEVLIDNTWHTTIVKFDNSTEGCKTTDGIDLLGKRVKMIASGDYFRFKGRQ